MKATSTLFHLTREALQDVLGRHPTWVNVISIASGAVAVDAVIHKVLNLALEENQKRLEQNQKHFEKRFEDGQTRFEESQKHFGKRFEDGQTRFEESQKHFEKRFEDSQQFMMESLKRLEGICLELKEIVGGRKS